MKEVDVVTGQVWLDTDMQFGTTLVCVVKNVESSPDGARVAYIVCEANGVGYAHYEGRCDLRLFLEDAVLIHDPRWTAPLQVMKPQSVAATQPQEQPAVDPRDARVLASFAAASRIVVEFSAGAGGLSRTVGVDATRLLAGHKVIGLDWLRRAFGGEDFV
jgi:hypothetical protein